MQDNAAAYEHFMRAARADLFDVRGNACDGIHGASAGGLWQAVVFGFAGLKWTKSGWQTRPCLPLGWTRVAFKIVHNGQILAFDIKK
jgi:trehalose/maltose hydrolase-like predicted phosphorylase